MRVLEPCYNPTVDLILDIFSIIFMISIFVLFIYGSIETIKCPRCHKRVKTFRVKCPYCKSNMKGPSDS